MSLCQDLSPKGNHLVALRVTTWSSMIGDEGMFVEFGSLFIEKWHAEPPPAQVRRLLALALYVLFISNRYMQACK